MPASSNEQERLDIRIRRHPAFQVWVDSGGLVEFAKEHKLEPNFIDSLGEHYSMVMLQYFDRLSTVPGLREEMLYKGGMGKRKPLSDEAVEAAMACAEGWDIDDYEDDSEDEKSEQDNGKESVKADVKMKLRPKDHRSTHHPDGL